MKKLLILSFLLLLAWSTQAQQFRLSSQGGVSLLSTIDDSTYQVQVIFDGDLTGSAFFPINIQVGYRLFSQREQLYRITNVANADASQADLIIVEVDNVAVNSEGSPIGEVMVFDPGSSEEIPQVPFGSNGAGSNLQAAVVSYNSRITKAGLNTNDNRYQTVSVIDTSVDSAYTHNLIENSVFTYFNTLISDTVTSTNFVELPNANLVDSGKTVIVSLSSQSETADYYIATSSKYASINYNQIEALRYYLEGNEIVNLVSDGERWNLSNNRRVDNYFDSQLEAKRQRYITGESIIVNNQTYTVENANYLQDTADYFTVSAKIIEPANLLYNSELWTRRDVDGNVTGETWTYDNSFIEVLQNTTEVTDPNGTNRATKITEVNSTGSIGKYAVRAFGAGEIETGDTLVSSFYVRKSPNNQNASIRIRYQSMGLPSSGFITVVQDSSEISSTEWTYFEQLTVAGADRPTGIDFSFYFEDLELNDYIYVAFPEVSVAKKSDRYSFTGHNVNNSDTLYAVPVSTITDKDFVPREVANNGEKVKLENQAVFFSSFADLAQNDAHQLTLAIQSCATNTNCQDVIIDVPQVVVDTTWANDSVAIIMLNGIRLRGEVISALGDNNPEIVFALADSTAIGIWSEGVVTRQKISNINFSATSALGTFLDRGNTQKYRVENCSFDGTDLVKRGVVTGRYGSGDRALFSYLNNVSIINCDTNLIYQNTGNEHFIDESIVSRSNHAGIKVIDSGHLTVNRIDCENHDKVDLHFERAGGREIYFGHGYFENTNVYSKDLGTLVFRDNRFSGKDFNFTGATGFVEFSTNDMNEIVPILPKTVGGVFSYNIFSRRRFIHKLYTAHSNSPNVALNTNYFKEDSGFIYEYKGSKKDDVTGQGYILENSRFKGFLGDTITANNLVLKGFQQNLRPYSDSLGFESRTYLEIKDTIIGGFEYDMLVSDTTLNTGSGGLFSFPTNLSKTVSAGLDLVFSFEYMHLAAPTGKDTELKFSLLLNSTRERNLDPTILPPSIGGWNRVNIVADSLTTGVNRIKIEGAEINKGDKIVFRDFQVNEGDIRLAFIPTSAAGVDNTDVTITVGDTLMIKGVLNVSEKITGAFIRETTTLDFSSTAVNATQELTTTVVGAVQGDAVNVVPIDAATAARGTWSGRVSALNTVNIKFHNDNSGAYDPPLSNYNIIVTKF